MADLSIVAGSTSQSINVDLYILATGAPQTGLVYNSTSLTAYYSFTGANAGSVQISLMTLASTTTAYSSGGFIKIDDTNMPGIYRLDLPTGALAASKGREVIITLTGYSGMATRHIKIELTAVDNQSTGFGLVNASANVAQWNSSNVASPATAGIPDVNVKNMNNVAATSITTVSAYQGTTQPVNFTGTAGSALAKVDVTDIATVAVATGTAQLGVNVVNIGGSPSTGAAGYVGIDWNHVNAPTTAVGLSGTTISTGQTIATVTNQLTAGAIATGVWTDAVAGDFTTSASIGKSIMNGVALGTGLTINGYTGNTVQTGDSFARIGSTGSGLTSLATPTNITAGTITTVTNLTNAPTVGDFTSTMKTSLNSATPVCTVSGDLSATMKTSVTTACTASTPTVAGVSGVTFPATVASPTNITAGTITTVTNLTNAPTNGDLTATMKTSVTTAATASTPTIAGYAGGQDPATLVLGATAASWNMGGTIGAKINSAASAGDPWTTSLPGAYTSGEAGYIVGNYLNGAVALASGVNVTKWNGTAVSTPSTAGIPDVNIKNVNNVTVNGVGSAGNPWGP